MMYFVLILLTWVIYNQWVYHCMREVTLMKKKCGFFGYVTGRHWEHNRLLLWKNLIFLGI